MAGRNDEEFQGLVPRGVKSLNQELGHRACGKFNKVKYCERTCRARDENEQLRNQLAIL